MNKEAENQILNEIENLNQTQQKIFEKFAKEGFLDQLAMILSYMEADLSSECLKTYPESFQKIITEKMKDFPRENENTMLQTARVLVDANFNKENFAKYKNLIKNHALNEVGLLNIKMQKKNPILCASLCELNNSDFSEIAYLSNRDIQRLLRVTDQIDIAKALKNATEEVKNKIFNNMSIRAANMLKEDMEFMGPVRLSDVIESQSEILSNLTQLITNGEIYYTRNNDTFII